MIKFSKDFIWKNEAWNLQKTVSGFKFNKNWRFDKILVRILYEKMRLEIFRFLRFCQGLSFWRSLLAFDAWFWRYLSCLSALGSHRAAFRSRLWLVFVVAGGTLTSHCSGAADFQSKKCIIKTNIDVKFTTCVRHVSCLASVEFGSALDELIFYERGAS